MLNQLPSFLFYSIFYYPPPDILVGDANIFEIEYKSLQIEGIARFNGNLVETLIITWHLEHQALNIVVFNSHMTFRFLAACVNNTLLRTKYKPNPPYTQYL